MDKKECEIDDPKNCPYKKLIQDALRWCFSARLGKKSSVKETIAKIIENQKKHGDDRDGRSEG